MEYLRSAVISILMMLAMCGCSRLESSQIDISNFFGAWQEYYGPDYHIEGSRIWYISEESIRISTYDWYSDTSWDQNVDYSLEQNKGKHMIILHFLEDTGTRDESYSIVKLTDEEMIWERVDIKGDTRHFVKSKYWQTHQE
jgi:hypothetical protein